MFGTYCRLNVHVHASNMTVIKAEKTKLVPFRKEHRESRKRFYRAMLDYHYRRQQELVVEYKL